MKIMKEIKLDEEHEEKLSKQITKILKRKKRKEIITWILLIIFTFVVTMTFSKIGAKLDAEFIFGQLCIGVVCGTIYLFKDLLEKDCYAEIESLILNDENVAKKINDAISQYEKEKDGRNLNL